MSFLGKIMNSMRLSDDDDDYFLDDDYEDEKPARKSIFVKKDNDYYDDYDEDEPPKPRFLGKSSAKVVPMKQQPSAELSMIRPTSIEDAEEIGDYLLAGKAVVLNMEGLHMEVAQRIIDFTSGATYAINGNLQKISNYIFIAVPASVDLSGDFQGLNNSGLDMPGMNLRL
ncbi:MAG: cell division protein SepF [Hungatella sp.]|nr:cell division protein SepF [Hungatella sp.]